MKQAIGRNFPLILAAMLVAAMIIWGGLWFILRPSAVGRAEAIIAQDNNFSYTKIGVRGFPNRYDIAIDAPSYSGEGFRIACPSGEIDTLRWQGQQLILAFEAPCQFELDGRDLTLRAGALRASVIEDKEILYALDEPRFDELPEFNPTAIVIGVKLLTGGVEYGARIHDQGANDRMIASTTLADLLDQILGGD